MWAAAFPFLAIDTTCGRCASRTGSPPAASSPALALAGVTRGTAGVAHALMGAGVALAVLFVPFLLRWLGAGDVKAMMVLGALWGRELVVPTLFWMFVAGGALAIALVAARGELYDLCTRWRRSLWITLSTRRLTFFAPSPGSAAGGGLPFAVAIGIGASIIRSGGSHGHDTQSAVGSGARAVWQWWRWCSSSRCWSSWFSRSPSSASCSAAG